MIFRRQVGANDHTHGVAEEQFAIAEAQLLVDARIQLSGSAVNTHGDAPVLTGDESHLGKA
jgi:hypothetical protein